MFSKRRILSIIALGAILIFLIYHPAINGYFLSEDYEWWAYVRGKNLLEVLGYFISPPVNTADVSRSLIWQEYRPLIGLSFWFDVNFFWMKPFFFHLTNLIIHLGNYLLVVALTYGFLKRVWPAILAGFLFIIFPFHSEVVVWMDARSSSLAALFYLTSFCLFLKWTKSERMTLFYLSLLSFAIAITAKETAVSLPLAMTAYLIFNGKGNLSKRFKEVIIKTIGFWAVFIFYFYFRGFYVGQLNIFEEAGDFNPVFTRITGFYIFFLIFSITFFYLVHKVKKINPAAVKMIIFLAILIGIFFLPTIWIPTQERYLYLPSAAACIYVANLFFIFWENKIVAKTKLFKAALVIIILLISASSFSYLNNRVKDWEKASDVAHKILSDFRVYAKDIPEDSPVYFFNLPDNYHQSYIFRAYLSDAIKYETGKTFEKVLVPSAIRGLGKSTVIIKEKSELILESENSYLVSMPNFSRTLPSGEKVIENEYYQILWTDDRRLNLTLKKDFLGKENVYFFYYDPTLNKLLRME